MMATPRTACGRNISCKIGFGRLPCAHEQTGCKQGKAKKSELAGVNALLEIYCQGRGRQLSDAGDKHDLANPERIVFAHQSEKERHQVRRAKEPDTENKTQSAANGEIAILETS